MEKHERFGKLKEGQVPENFLQTYPVLANLILSMLSYTPEARPEIKDIVSIIKTQLENLKIENVNELTNTNNNTSDFIGNVYLKCKRDRSNSADLNGTNIYSVSYTNEDNLDKDTQIFVKLIDNKLLILPKIDSIKAKIVYDLSESDLTLVMKKEQAHISIDHPFLSGCTIVVEMNTSEDLIEKMKKFF